MKDRIIVVGGGLVGSAAAWQIAQTGTPVLLLERQAKGADLHSSRGQSRICRIFSRQHAVFGQVHNRTVALVKELVAFLNSQGIDAQMDAVYKTSPVTYAHMHVDQEEVEKLANQQGMTYTYAPDKKSVEGLLDMNIGDEQPPIVFRERNQYSGTLNPQQLIAYLHQAIELKGGEVRYERHVKSITRKVEGYQLSLNGKFMHASQLIVAAGAYTSKALQYIYPAIGEAVVPKRIGLCFFRLSTAFYERLSQEQQQKLQNAFPYINYQQFYYAMLEEGDSSPLIKCGLHFNQYAIDDLDEVWHKRPTNQEKDELAAATLKYLHQLGITCPQESLELVDGYSCVYSMTQNETPFVTTLPNGFEDLVVACGFSGIGAKGCLAYGAFAAEQLLPKSLLPDQERQWMEQFFGKDALKRALYDIITREDQF